jgi:hypothetical protein
MAKHPTTGFAGTIKELRRGGWAARGLVVTSRNSQIFETQVGPRAFESEDLCAAWLRSAAAGLNIDDVRIVIDTQRQDFS